MMNKETFQARNLTDSSRDALVQAFNSTTTKTAYFVKSKVCYWAEETAYDAVFNLCGAAEAYPKVIANYDYKLSDAATGALVLHKAEKPPAVSKPETIEADRFRKCSINVAADLAQMFKVPAGSDGIVADIQATNPSTKENGVITSNGSGMRSVHRLYLAAAYTILRHAHAEGRAGVVALIVAKNGRILSWGQKNGLIPCWHGETSAIMALGGVIPKGSTVYSTLKPCKMCAGMIVDASKGDARVYWGMNDPADSAKNTAIDKAGTGMELDGNKVLTKPIFLEPKKNPGEPRANSAGVLDDKFGKSGGKSAVDYIMTPEALEIIRGVEGMLKAKHAKYDGGTGANANTGAVVRYLIGFLDSLNIKFPTLGA